jgi:ATP-dependent exoDNAse (exonuclease V) alpha subunit
VGSLPSVTEGDWLAAEGWWVRDKEHGLQFKASTMKTVPPTTAEGIERYLGSGLVKGIGPILAKKLVGRFGADVLARTEPPNCNLWTESAPSAGSGSRTHGKRQRKSAKSCVPAQPRREHQPGGPNLQDLWRACNREGAATLRHAAHSYSP